MTKETGDKARLDDPSLYINRELSWLEFNARVLAEAANDAVPLYERLKFLAIFSNNLDEFFMVRVAGLRAQLSGEIEEMSPDGLTPEQQLTRIARRAHVLVEESDRVWRELIRPRLADAGVALLSPEELDPAELAQLDKHFERDVFPVLTPIAIDPVHPFPHVRNKSINVGVMFQVPPRGLGPAFGLVQVPTTLPRMIRVAAAKHRRAFVALEDLILRHKQRIFPQMKIEGDYAFRVTRNFDIEVDEEEAEDLLQSLQAELRKRDRGAAVSMSVTGGAPAHSIAWLCSELDLDPERDVYPCAGPLHLADMLQLVSGDERRDLRDEPFAPQHVPPLRDAEDAFSAIRERDVLLHHPYESFEAVVDFLFQAAEDPDVLAIKQTLYRTGGESPMVKALQRAAELGKQVTALVELKARFDEESNIRWARQLERSGVNVMYGLMGLKTHAKVLLVVRREPGGLRRYVHLATGNYNQQTARSYADLSLFTAREDIGEDATALFNLLTGYSAPALWRRLVVAPLGLHEAVLGLVLRETEHARAGRKAHIIAKMNALVDADVIRALYGAARAGVEIDLLVRGVCCLRPGVAGVSEKIRVRATIDRYLEHARIFAFANGGEDEVYLSSADWMPRNFRRRVEVMFPVLDERLRRRLLDEVLLTQCGEDPKSWLLGPDGMYQRSRGGAARSQQRFMELARQSAKDQTETFTIAHPAWPLAAAPAPTAAAAEARGRKRRRKRKRLDD